MVLEKNNCSLDAIWFGHIDDLGERVRVAFRLDAEWYNGTTKVHC